MSSQLEKVPMEMNAYTNIYNWNISDDIIQYIWYDQSHQIPNIKLMSKIDRDSIIIGDSNDNISGLLGIQSDSGKSSLIPSERAQV